MQKESNNSVNKSNKKIKKVWDILKTRLKIRKHADVRFSFSSNYMK